MDTTKTTTHIGLCAGYGGIELGLHRVISNLRSVALCEIEGFAIANLVAKMEAGLMDPAPIWPDLKTFPWRAFRDRVDILTGGYPCQPFSAAGKRAGKDDPRHLWPWIAGGIGILRPRICFFENVEGHISLGLRDVIEDLGRLGYRTTWGIFSAVEVGAPHQRKRVFILAVASGFRSATGLSGPFPRHEGQSGESDDGGDQAAWPSRPSELADSKLHGCHHTDERSDADGIQGSLGQKHEHWQAVRDGQLWPSRPGQPQYGWEPPRVVADSDRLDGSASAEGRQHDPKAGHAVEAVEKSDQLRLEEHGLQHAGVPVGSGGGTNAEAVGDAASARCGRITGDLGGTAPEEGCQGNQPASPATDCGGAGAEEAVGDTEGRDGLWSAQREAGHVAQPDEGMVNSEVFDGERKQFHVRQREGEHRGASGSECSGRRQTQPTLGGDADGPSGGLDYAELCVSCDNRTDELRLLGNGVVPATAERAFRVLMQELMR